MSKIKSEKELGKLYVADCLKKDYPNVYEQLLNAVGPHLGVIELEARML